MIEQDGWISPTPTDPIGTWFYTPGWPFDYTQGICSGCGTFAINGIARAIHDKWHQSRLDLRWSEHDVEPGAQDIPTGDMVFDTI